MTTHTYDNDEGLPVLTKKQTAHNEDGLPILKKQSSDLPIVKKKDLIGGTVSTDGSTEPKSISLTKEEQDDLDKRMGKVKPVEEHDEDFINDPVKNITQPLRNKLTQTNNEYRQSGLFNRNVSESTNQTRVGNAGGLKESYERDLQNSYHQLDNVTDQVVKTLLPNGKKATEYAVHQIKKNGGIAPENNETFNIAAAKAGQYISLKDKLSNGKSLTQVGVDMERELDPNLDKQISVLEQDKNGGHRTGSSGLGTDIYDNILPGVTQGRITDRLIHQPDIDVISSENPKVKQAVNYLKNGGLYERFPDYGISEMSNELSRERQKIGKNNIIANPIFNSSKFMDNLAEQMYKDTPWKLKFYNEKFKNHLQRKIDTPGVVDEFGTGAKETFNQMGASLKDVVGLGDNAPDRIYNELEKEGSQVSSGVEGWRKWAGQAARFAGMIAAMSTASGALKATGLSPAAINGVVASDAFYDSERNSWTMKYPDEPLKAQLGAILTTAAFAAGGKAFPGGKVAEALSEKMAPEIKAALGNLEEGVISKEAKKGLIDKFGQFLKETVKGTGEATAIVAGVNAFENAFDQVAGDPQMIAKYHPDNKIIEDAKSMIIGSVFPQALIAAKNVGIVGNSLIDIAERPEVYEPNIKQLLDEGKITPEEYNKKLEDITLLSKTRETLNQQGVTEANQKRALVETLNEKYKKERIANQPESAITRRTQKEIRGSQEVQDKIMNGEDVVGDEVKSHLTPKENEIIDILKSKTELGNEKASEMGKALFNAVKDPENHKAIIKELVDQSSDPDALEINVGKKITDAVLSLSEKSTQKTVEELDNETKNIAESIKGNEPTKAGEATEPILTIDEGGKEPPKTPIESQAEPKEPNTVGIKHESLKKIAEKMGLPQPERGTFLTPEEQTKRGRLLLQGGADPEKIAMEFKDDGKVNADIISVARAHFENLVKEQQAALDKYGKNSPQEAAARLAADKWATDITKPMATASGGALSAHIGETDLDTGSFVSIQRATEQETGKPIEKWQERKINELTAKNNELKKQTDDLEAKLIEATNESIGKEKSKGTFTEKAKKAADVFRKLKTKPFKFKDENGNEYDVKQSGLPWNELVELGAKAIEKTGQIADGVAKVINKIKDEIWYIKLSDNDKGRLSAQLSEHFSESEQAKAESLDNLQKQFVDKKGNKFTTDEAKAIWGHAKKNYLDKGSSYRDMIMGVSNDLGLSWRQVNEAITSPKTKPISDAMWKKRGEYMRQQTAAKNWVNDQTANPALKALKKVSGAFRGVAVFGHAGIFVGTHAGMTFFQPTTWKYTIPAFFRGWKFGYGNTGAYERRIEEFKNSPNYTLAQRAGLKNNPDRINAEEYQKSQKFLGKLGLAGERGFNAIKILRQDLFDHEYNKLSDDAKQDPQSAKNVAKLINNATGATNLKIPEWVNEASFAGGMEAARWGKLTRNPAKATTVALKAIFAPGKATIGERVFAKVWARRVGEQLATYAGALAANAAIQNTLHPNNPTNLTNPNKPDYLKFKFGDVTIDPTSGMRGVMNFIYGIGKIPFEQQKELKGDTRMQAAGKQAFGYSRGKLAPLYSTIADFFTQQDFNRNPLPFSNDKPTAGHHKLTWGEYAWSKAPLPVAEAANVAYKAAEENSGSKMIVNNIMTGIVSGAISGSTGFRVGEYNSEEAKHSPFTESDNKEPEFKYFLDKGLELPNTVHSSEEITDEKNHTKKNLSDYPKDIQKEYDELHKSLLKKELGNIINKNHVFVKEYTDADGGSKDQVSFTHSIHSKRKSLDELDEEELAQVLKLSQAEATRKTKEKLFK